MAPEFYVAAFLNGTEIPSSAVFAGSLEACKACAGRMNRRGYAFEYRVLPCKGFEQ